MSRVATAALILAAEWLGLSESIGMAALIMAGQGFLFAAILATAYRYLKVEEDPRIEAVEEMLPGSNCGACGQPGCRAFAEAVVSGDQPPSKCTVSSPDGLEAIADFLGVEAGAQVRNVARLHCAGGKAQSSTIASYEGRSSCAAAALVAGGGKACAWGCLGLGDCEVACTFDAIAMNRNGLPVVDIDKCTACGDCVEACPRGLFEILPLDLKIVVQCSAPLGGEQATALCSVACDACGRCAADAPEAIRMVNDLPVVDPETGRHAPRAATNRCPTGAIQWVEGDQFEIEIPPESRRPHVLAG